MKNLKQILSIFLVAVLMLSLQHCELFDLAKPKSELDKLPPATQEGKSTFGCLINGKAWYTFNYNNVKADYQLGSLGFGATVYNPTEGIGFDLTEETNDPPLSIGTYSLLNTDQYKPGVSVFKSISCLYGGGPASRSDITSGTLVITKFDKVNFIVSGTFEFTASHTGCETLTVTNGRFDTEYAP